MEKYSFGVNEKSSSQMYITMKYPVKFKILRPGLSEDANSASLQSVEDNKVVVSQKNLLELKEIQPSEDFKRAATFKIISDKFFSVSNIYHPLPTYKSLSIIMLLRLSYPQLIHISNRAMLRLSQLVSRDITFATRVTVLKFI